MVLSKITERNATVRYRTCLETDGAVQELDNENCKDELVLKLDVSKTPIPISEHKRMATSSQELVNTFFHGEKYAIGSVNQEDQVFYPGDLGLFGCVFEAWRNHWSLRTRPEDWWGPVAQTIAKSVDKAAKGNNQKVRDLFVSHEGKQLIKVDVMSPTIYTVNYEGFFSAISSQIEAKIKVPKYAQVMQNDFGTSGPAHKIASQINLMASVQEFFEYRMGLCICGLKGLEMIGSVEDWEHLVTKLQEVRAILEPIKNEIRLYNSWWEHVLYVFQNLANTRKNPDHHDVAEFWKNILLETTGEKYVGGNSCMPGRPVPAKAFNGWLIKFLTDCHQILAEDITNDKDINEKLSGWNSVPMSVTMKGCSPPIEDDCTLVAGIIGFKVHSGLRNQNTSNDSQAKKQKIEQIPAVEANHMWAMMLSPHSKLCG